MNIIQLLIVILVTAYSINFSQEYVTLKGHKGNVNSIAFSPDSKIMASGDENGNLYFWSADSFKAVYNLTTGSNITSVNFSPGSQFVYTQYNGTVNIMNAETKEILYNFSKNDNSYYAVYSNDGKQLLVAYLRITDKGKDSPQKMNYYVDIHETGNYTVTKKLKTGEFDMPIGTIFGENLFGTYRSNFFSCDISASGKYVASGSQGNNIPIYSFDFGKFIPPYKSHTDQVFFVTFSPDGNYLASASKDETAKIWNITSGSSIKTLSGHTSDVNSVAFSPDSKYLASASDDGTVKIWDVKTTKLIHTLEGFNADVITVKFSPDGKLLAASGKSENILVWKTNGFLKD